MIELVAVDIGGTHARFALAGIEAGRIRLGPETVLKTGDYPGVKEAWGAYGQHLGRALPPRASIAIAAPIEGDDVRMVNNHWAFRQSKLPDALCLEAVRVLNDFEAIAHALPHCPADIRHFAGPDAPLPGVGVISMVGPGTGLGVAILYRSETGDHVIGTEAAHISFAPLDALEKRVHDRLVDRFGRASVERVVSGPGLREIYAMLGGGTGLDDATLWRLALEDADAIAREALDCFCRCFGAAAGDIALAHGAHAVVIAGGLGLRLAEYLPSSGFVDRFRDKGRYRPRMERLPIKLLLHPQPGLLGAAAAFASQVP